MFCQKCGTQVPEGAAFCPSCGQASQTSQASQNPPPPPQYSQNNGSSGKPGYMGEDFTSSFDPADAEANKVMALLSYIIFFVPLITGDHKKSPFVKFHVNQGTLLFITAIGYSVISSILRTIIKTKEVIWGVPVYYTPGWLNTVLGILYLPILALLLIGIINVLNKKAIELPVIGKFRIIN